MFRAQTVSQNTVKEEMITILKSELNSVKEIDEIRQLLEEKTIKTENSLDWISTVNMVDNHKDFYGYYIDDSLAISRIRRLGLLRILPKLIVKFDDLSSFRTFKIQLGLFTLTIGILLLIAIGNGLYELVHTREITNDLISVILAAAIYLGLLWIELSMYRQKFRKYFG